MPFPLFVLISFSTASATIAATLLLSRWHLWAVGSIFAGATALLLFHGWYFDYFADDSYITLRYSRHLADGLGPNWNSVGRVEGYTSFLWMASLAAVAKLGFDLVLASRVFGFLALVATYFFVYRIWRLWADDESSGGLDSPVLLASVLLGLAMTDSVAFWGFSGMETPLFATLVTASAYFYLRERRGGGFPWSAVAVAATALTRPEGLIVAGVTGVFILVDAMRESDRRRALTRWYLWGVVFLLLYGSYFLWRYDYYGYLFPNTYYAKVGLTVATLDRGLRDIATSGLQYHLLAMFVGASILFASQSLRRDAAYIVTLTGVMVAAVVVEGGTDSHSRFLAPVLPLLFLSGLGGFTLLLRRATLRPAHMALVTSLALGLGALALLPNSYDPLIPLGRRGLEERQLLATWFNEHTPEHFVIADTAIGATSYYANDRAILDMLGLNDVVIAHTEIPDMGKGPPAHEKYNIDYVLDRARPEIIVLGQVHPRPLTVAELRPRLRGSFVKAWQLLIEDPRLWERYSLRAVDLNGRWFHFLQRNDTVSQLQEPGLQ